MMNRIDEIFQRLRSTDAKALMPYITAGDPTLDATIAMLPAVESAGADICELGFPYSDPIADGPTIQASMNYVLNKGLHISDIFESVARQRSKVNLGLVAMVSYSIVHRMGVDTFMSDAAAAGFDGTIVPDLPVEEADGVHDAAGAAGLTCSLLIAPTTPIERAQKLAQASSGFIYLLARAGLTGERSQLPADLPDRVNRLRDVTDLPIAVGFGISTAQQVQEVVQVADAAIVGSAIMRRVAEARDQEDSQVVELVQQFIAELAGGLSPQTTVA